LPTLANLAYQPIAFGVCNPAQAKGISSGPLDWTAATSYTLDPTQSNQLLEVRRIQSVFIDNSSSTGTTTVTIAGTYHVLRVAPNSQAYLPIVASDRPVFLIENASGDGSTRIVLLNVPLLAGLWRTPPDVSTNLLTVPNNINLPPWFVSGAGVSATGPTTLQTGTDTSSIAQFIAPKAGTAYRVNCIVSCPVGTVFIAVYAADFSSSYGSQLVTLSGFPQVIHFQTIRIPAGVTSAVFELDFSGTAGNVATITGSQVF
jgi:hypothetical protein